MPLPTHVNYSSWGGQTAHKLRCGMAPLEKARHGYLLARHRARLAAVELGDAMEDSPHVDPLPAIAATRRGEASSRDLEAPDPDPPGGG